MRVGKDRGERKREEGKTERREGEREVRDEISRRRKGGER